MSAIFYSCFNSPYWFVVVLHAVISTYNNSFREKYSLQMKAENEQAIECTPTFTWCLTVFFQWLFGIYFQLSFIHFNVIICNPVTLAVLTSLVTLSKVALLSFSLVPAVKRKHSHQPCHFPFLYYRHCYMRSFCNA